MKKIVTFLVITFLSICVTPAFALIRTENVEVKDYGSGESKFKVKVAYTSITEDVGKNTSAANIPIQGGTPGHSFDHVMPFKGSIVGISIAANEALEAGSITVDASINGTATGFRTALDYSGESVRHTQSGMLTANTQYNYNTLHWDDTSPPDWGGGWHDSNHLYGKITELEAGDRVGVLLSTSSDVEPDSVDICVTVIVLQ